MGPRKWLGLTDWLSNPIVPVWGECYNCYKGMVCSESIS